MKVHITKNLREIIKKNKLKDRYPVIRNIKNSNKGKYNNTFEYVCSVLDEENKSLIGNKRELVLEFDFRKNLTGIIDKIEQTQFNFDGNVKLKPTRKHHKYCFNFEIANGKSTNKFKELMK